MIFNQHGQNLMSVIRENDNDRWRALMTKEVIHGKYQRTDIDERQLSKLDKYQRRYLNGRVCAMCEMPLDRTGCGTWYVEMTCPWRVRWKRRHRCLKKYKPRLERRKA